MPYNGSGTFSIINSFLPNTTILSAAVNQNLNDIASGLSDVLTRDGQAGMLANLAMGNNKVTGMADPSASTDAATKNYVDTQFNTAWSTGDVKLTLKTVADSGWLLFDDTTMGSASSGANHASSANQALFELLYDNINDTNCPILTSSGAATTRGAQGTSSQAWAANCRMTLPKTLGRALAVAGAGSGLTSRALGSTVGGETQTLITANLPPYTPSGSVSTVNSQAGNGTVQFPDQGGPTKVMIGGTSSGGSLAQPMALSSSFSGSAQGGTSTAFSIMQPSSFMNAMVKL